MNDDDWIVWDGKDSTLPNIKDISEAQYKMFRPAGGWKNYLTDLMDCNPKMWDLDTAQYRYKLKKTESDWIVWDGNKETLPDIEDLDEVQYRKLNGKFPTSWKSYSKRPDGTLISCCPWAWPAAASNTEWRYKLKKEIKMETAGTQWNYFGSGGDRKNRPDMTKNVIIQYFDKKTKSWVDYKKNAAGEYYVDPTRWYWDIYSYNNIIRRWTYDIVEPMKFGDIVTFTETGKYTGDYNANYIIVQNDGSTYIVKRENIVKYEDRKKADIKAKIAELELAIKTHEQNIADLKLQLTSQ